VSLNDILQMLIYLGLLVLVSIPLGSYLARVFQGEPTFLDPVMRPVELAIYRACGIDPAIESGWVGYTADMLYFSAAGMLLLYGLGRLQGILPLNPEGFGAVSEALAFNTAASFTTNTNWQAYAGEATMSYLTQMAGLAYHNFVSAAAGIAIAIAIIRGFVRHSAKTVGNFWVDLTRCTLWILLPLSVVIALILVWQGTPQNFSSYAHATTLEGAAQTIPQGPVASQIAIKQLGTNGGGFFNANSAHPYENPTRLTNLIEMLAILALGGALTLTFGKMAGDMRQGWALFAAMAVLYVMTLVPAVWSEQHGNPQFASMGINQAATGGQSGGNMEGKEVRFGIVSSGIWETATTAASNGSVNSMHDSFTPLGGLMALVNLHLGEVVFGGVGSGLYGMLVMAVLAVFIAGLMVGRTPEYLGKKIQAREMKLVMLYVLIFPALILLPAAAASVTEAGLASRANMGPHGFSEILYAFSSAVANNGSAFAGLNANTTFYNVTLGITMLSGRFMMAIPALAIAGSLAGKKIAAPSAGTFPTNGATFVVLLVSVVVIVGALTFFPALALGPIVEQLAMMTGRLF
jgi:K+-transporting ATPase ATPase A chain